MDANNCTTQPNAPKLSKEQIEAAVSLAAFQNFPHRSLTASPTTPPSPYQAALRQLGEQLGEGGVLKNEEGEEIIDIREDITEEYNDDDDRGTNNNNSNNTTTDVLLSSSDDEFEDLMQEMEEIELEEEEESNSKYTEKQPSRQSNGLKRGFLLGSGTTTAGLYEDSNDKAPPIHKRPIQPISRSKQQAAAAAFTGQVVERISSSNEGTVPAVPISSSSSKPVSKFKQRIGR